MKGKSHLAILDGLRGAMCLWVLIGHTCTETAFSIPVFRSPRYAVDGFMILSGFLMAYHAMLRADQQPWTRLSTWLKFYIRRYFRISVLYYVLLVPAYLFSAEFIRWRLTTYHRLGLRHVPVHIQSGSVQDFLLHLTYAFGLLRTHHASNVLPDWSLSLEMQFYALFPLFMLLALRFGWAAFSIAASLVWLLCTWPALHVAQQFWQPSPLPLSLIWFAIGMLWANAYLETSSPRRRAQLLLSLALSLLSRDPHDIVLVAVFAWLLFAEGWLSLAGTVDFARRMLSGPVSQFLARASYSVYLLHLLILTPLAYLACTRLHLTPAVRFLLVLTATALLSYGIARPLEWIENWGISLGKRLSEEPARKRGPRKAGRRPLESVVAVISERPA